MIPSLFFLVFITLLYVSFSQVCPANEVSINSVCRCLPPNVRVNGLCQSSCPPQNFLDLKKYSCEPCDSTCSECWGPGPNQCLRCAGTNLFNPFLGICEPSCTQSTLDGGRGVCVGLLATCSGLESDLPFMTATGGCQSTCNIPYDVLGSSAYPYNLCGFDMCDATCGRNPDTQNRQCLGMWNPGSCLVCNGQNSINIHVAKASNGQDIYSCARQAPTNSYYSTEAGKYYMCSPLCGRCSGAPDNCVVCGDGLVQAEDGTCVQECPTGTIAETNELGQRVCTAVQEECPEGTTAGFNEEGQRVCIPIQEEEEECPAGTTAGLDENGQRICIAIQIECPAGTTASLNENGERVCVPIQEECPAGTTASFSENGERVCTPVQEECPAGTTASLNENGERVCTPIQQDCPAGTTASFNENGERVCTPIQEDCPAGTVAGTNESGQRICTPIQEDCPAGTTAGFNENGQRVCTPIQEDCPAGTTASYNENGQRVCTPIQENCPPGTTAGINGSGQRVCIPIQQGGGDGPVIENPQPPVVVIPVEDSKPVVIKREEEPLVENVVKYNNAGGTTISVSVAGLQVINPGNPSMVSTILLVNLLQYVRYLSINYPKNLEGTFARQTQDIGTLNFGPMVPDSVVDEVKQYKASHRFDKFGVNRFFLVNFWRGITTSLILAVGVGVVMIIRRLTFKNKIAALVQEQLTSFVLWNFIFTFVLSNIDNISIFTIVEYQTLSLDSAFSVISFMLNLVCLVGSLLLLVYIPRRLYQLRKQDPYKKKEDKLKEHDSIKVLFEKFKNQYFAQEILLFMIGARALLNNIIIAAFDSPTAQCCMLMILGIAMLAYLIAFRPNVEILCNIELVVYEVIIFIVNCTCLHLSTLDSSEQAKAERAGETILVCNIVAMTFSLVICVLKIIVQAWTIIKKQLAERKAQKRVEKVKDDLEESRVIPNESITLEIKISKDPHPIGTMTTYSTRNQLSSGPESQVIDSKVIDSRVLDTRQELAKIEEKVEGSLLI